MARVTQNSFTAGEISPSLYGRIDVNKYGIGLKSCVNGIVMAEGGVYNRSGLELVCEVKDSSKKVRLIPFAFNINQTYIIEAGDSYFRYIKDGGQIVNGTTVVETAHTVTQSQLFEMQYSQTADTMTICHQGHMPFELARNSETNWTVADIVIEPSIAAPTGVTATHSGSLPTATQIYGYLVTAIKADTYEESKRSNAPNATAGTSSSWLVGEKVTIAWTAVTGATEYKIYKSINGVFGYIGTSIGTSFEDPNITPDMSNTAPIFKNPFDAVGNYPATTNYFQQRRVFANTINLPRTIESSQTGFYTNFSIGRPLLATDAITTPIDEREQNAIRHLVSMTDLIAFTTGGEWKVNGSDGIFSATPPPQCLLQSSWGSADNIIPIVSGNMVLFVTSGQNVVRNLGYSYLSNSYDGKELTLFAKHIFKGRKIIDWAYAKEPNRIVWCVLDDGTVAGLTYNQEQEVMGWHRHKTDGLFESIATIREGTEDIPYFVVKREINGATKRFIERMKPRIIQSTKDGFFVDCGLAKTFETPVQEIGGLAHLEGKAVNVLADSVVYENLIVSGGKISLGVNAGANNTARNIVVGLPYTFDFETLPIEGDSSIGLKKIISRVSVKVDDSRADFNLINGNGVAQKVNEKNWDVFLKPDVLFSGDLDIPVGSVCTKNATVHLQQSKPIPLGVLTVGVEMTVGNA